MFPTALIALHLLSGTAAATCPKLPVSLHTDLGEVIAALDGLAQLEERLPADLAGDPESLDLVNFYIEDLDLELEQNLRLTRKLRAYLKSVKPYPATAYEHPSYFLSYTYAHLGRIQRAVSRGQSLNHTDLKFVLAMDEFVKTNQDVLFAHRAGRAGNLKVGDLFGPVLDRVLAAPSVREDLDYITPPTEFANLTTHWSPHFDALRQHLGDDLLKQALSDPNLIPLADWGTSLRTDLHLRVPASLMDRIPEAYRGDSLKLMSWLYQNLNFTNEKGHPKTADLDIPLFEIAQFAALNRDVVLLDDDNGQVSVSDVFRDPLMPGGREILELELKIQIINFAISGVGAGP